MNTVPEYKKYFNHCDCLCSCALHFLPMDTTKFLEKIKCMSELSLRESSHYSWHYQFYSYKTYVNIILIFLVFSLNFLTKIQFSFLIRTLRGYLSMCMLLKYSSSVFILMVSILLKRETKYVS